MSDYIGTARETIVGIFGRNTAGNHREHCGACDLADPLTDTSPIYGGKPGEVPGACDVCRVTWESLSARAQADHDRQQQEWSRESRVDTLIEMGVSSPCRWRVY